MLDSRWLQKTEPAFRLMIATSWLAPNCCKMKQEAAIREAIATGLDWTEYLRLVDRHRTPALSWAALKRVPGLGIPPSAEQELRRRSDACRMQAVRHCVQLAGILKAFNRVRVPVMPLKGLLLSSEIYGDVGLRQSHDLDLAVMPEDLTRAQICLGDLGWHLDSSYRPMTPRQWRELWRNEKHLSMIDSQAESVLELHWRFKWDQPGQYGARLDRCTPALWQGCEYLVIHPIDQLLYLCCHGAEHAWSRAKWLGDLARIHASGGVDWQAALEQARGARQVKPLLLCLRLLEVVHGLTTPALQTHPSEELSPFFVDTALYALHMDHDPGAEGAPNLLLERWRLFRYEKRILPRRNWLAGLVELFYCRDDFAVLRLPDRFYWAYAPLRPFLWLWRWG